MKNLVIVESPAKAGVIERYLGKDFRVIASYGHVRDLPSKTGSVDPQNNFYMSWQISNPKSVKNIIKNAKEAQNIYLATDPDREGEAISWHINQILIDKKINITPSRAVFFEINKPSVVKAINNPRNLNDDLVNSYLSRVSLDYLVGFTLSPLLWRKLPGSRSAGRVQSVALRILCEREDLIEKFVPQKYWLVDAFFKAGSLSKVGAGVFYWQKETFAKFAIDDEKKVKDILKVIEQEDFFVDQLQKKVLKRNPYPPFTTSTLQQSASSQLNFSPSKTMLLAQRLYEGKKLGSISQGLITYMRTDSLNISSSFISKLRTYITKNYLKDYLPSKSNIYKTKSKNAQEAHEAIRITDLSCNPDKIKQYLEPDELSLYKLIWARTIASQMSAARIARVTAILADKQKLLKLKTTQSTIVFNGFLEVYGDIKEDKNQIDLNKLVQGEKLSLIDVVSAEHFTSPPGRYSEASLIKKMEELGIGRPSTYAYVLKVLKTRNYVTVSKKTLFPQELGRIVNTFLIEFFDKYFGYDFTSNMEKDLDEIAAGRQNYLPFLRKFWQNFDEAVQKTTQIPRREIRSQLTSLLAWRIFSPTKSNVCPKCKKGKLLLGTSKWGYFVSCSTYPDCDYIKNLDEFKEDNDDPSVKHSTAIREFEGEIYLKKNQYGLYLQQGNKKIPLGRKKEEDISEELVKLLVSLPKAIGDTGDLTLNIGIYGPYVKEGKKNYSLPASVDLLNIQESEIKKIITYKKGKVLGQVNKMDVTVIKGRYGPYITYKKKNYKIPKTVDFMNLNLTEAKKYIK